MGLGRRMLKKGLFIAVLSCATSCAPAPLNFTPLTAPSPAILQVDLEVGETAPLKVDPKQGGESQAELARYRFTHGGGEEIGLKTIRFTRVGFNPHSLLSRVCLYENDRRIAEGEVTEDAIIFSETGALMTLELGDVKVISVRADIGREASEDSHFGVLLADVQAFNVSGGQIRISADFPLRSPARSVELVHDLGRVVVASDSVSQSGPVNVQDDYEFWRITLEGKESSVELSNLSFLNKGTVGVEDIANMALYLGRQRLSSISNLDASTLQMTLDPPMVLPPDAPILLSLRGDIKRGVGKTLGFSLEHPADIVVRDVAYKARIVPTTSLQGGEVAPWQALTSYDTVTGAMPSIFIPKPSIAFSGDVVIFTMDQGFHPFFSPEEPRQWRWGEQKAWFEYWKGPGEWGVSARRAYVAVYDDKVLVDIHDVPHKVYGKLFIEDRGVVEEVDPSKVVCKEGITPMIEKVPGYFYIP